MIVILLMNFVYDFCASRLSSAVLITLVTLFFAVFLCVFPHFLGEKWDMVHLSEKALSKLEQTKIPVRTLEALAGRQFTPKGLRDELRRTGIPPVRAQEIEDQAEHCLSVTLPFLGNRPWKYVFITLYNLFVGVYSLFSITIFWSFVNEVFSSEEARHNFGTITAGGTLGGLLGSQITSYLSSKIRLGDMLFISLGVLLVTLVFMKLMLPYKIEEKKKTMASRDNSFSLVYSSTYLQWMLLAMFLTTSGGTMLAYQMNALVKTTIQDQAARAAFWANMNFWINGLGLFFQVVLVRFVILRFGMTTGLLISPLTDLTGSLMLSCSPRLSFGSFCQIGRYSTEYSFNRASKEMLYTPTTREFKYQAKALIDTFVFRAGDGIISLVLILLASAPLRYIAIISLFVNLLRILPALALAKEYRAILEKSGEKPPV